MVVGVEIEKIETKPARMNLTEALRSLRVGETLRLKEVNLGSLRTIARNVGILIRVRTLDDLAIEVTRRPDKGKTVIPGPVTAGEEMYDL